MVESVNQISLRKDLEIKGGYSDEKGNPVWQIYDPVQENFYAFSEPEYEVIRRLGTTGKDKIIQTLERMGFPKPEGLLNKTIAFLDSNFLLNGLKSKSQKDKKSHARFFTKILFTYIFFKIPICNPDRFFQRYQPLASTLFNRWIRLLFYLFALFGFAHVFYFWNDFAHTFKNSLNSSSIIPVITVMFFIKIFHEFSHGFTAKHFDCKIKSIGLAFIFFTPRLYTDISDSWKLTDKMARVKIDAAGIVFELIVGGICAFIWAWTYGPVSNICFYVFTVSTLNTLFVNGNPLMKFDGYYVLMDATNIRNLRERGVNVLRQVFHKLMLGKKTLLKADWSTSFIGVYGVFSFFYKIFIYTVIITSIYHTFSKELALVLILLEFGLLVLFPMFRESRILVREMTGKFRFFLSLVFLALLLSLLFIPFKQTLSLPCEFKPASSVSVYAKEKGFITNIYDEGPVVLKETLFVMGNEDLKDKISMLQFDRKLMIEEYKIAGQTPEELLQKKLIENKIQGIDKKIAAAKSRLEKLVVKSSMKGVFYKNRMVQTGQWCNAGVSLGEVINVDYLRVSIWVEEKNLEYISNESHISLLIDDRKIKVDFEELKPSPLQAVDESPLLTAFGGTVESYRSKENVIKPRTAYYTLSGRIAFDKLLLNRSGKAELTFYSSIFENIRKNIVSLL